MGASVSVPEEIRKIFDCVDNDDVEGLKVLMNYPNIFQIEDTSGYTILQRAIKDKRIAVFDFLLLLDDCPINACNSEGKTALDIARGICDTPQHFTYSLVKNGADIHCNYKGSSLLHYALIYNYLDLGKLLIEKGADLNCQDNYGRTPLHLFIKFNRYNDINEMLAMMLCLGADFSIPDDENEKPIDFVFNSHRLSESMLENLAFYYFDDYCTGYDIPVDNLFGLLRSDYSFTPQVLKHITSVNFDNISDYSSFDTYYFDKLFIIKPEYLKFLLEKFDWVIENIIDRPHDDNIMEYIYWEDMFIENFDLLLESQFGPDVLQIINKTRISRVIYSAQNLEPQNKLLELIMVLLSYGANINNMDLEYIYGKFGDGEFFRILLHMDIKISDENEQCDIMPALLYNINMDIETFLNNPDKFKYSSRHSRVLEELFSYFAHPKLKSYCCSESKDIYDKVKNLPSVPLLVELARNQVRKFLIQKYKIKNCMQFYTLIKHLPVSKVHEKIITLETKLY